MANNSFKDFVCDQLRALGGVEARAMFGGYGLYRDAVFFGIVHAERLYFKTDPQTRIAYQDRDMGPFRPNARQTLKDYYEVPPEVLEDSEEIVAWARAALSATRRRPGR